jgi:hypothetical protein
MGHPVSRWCGYRPITALPSPSSTPEQLIELVNVFTDIFIGLQAHHDELAILRRIQDRSERRVLSRYLFDALTPSCAPT